MPQPAISVCPLLSATVPDTAGLRLLRSGSQVRSPRLVLPTLPRHRSACLPLYRPRWAITASGYPHAAMGPRCVNFCGRRKGSTKSSRTLACPNRPKALGPLARRRRSSTPWDRWIPRLRERALLRRLRHRAAPPCNPNAGEPVWPRSALSGGRTGATMTRAVGRSVRMK